MRAYLIGAGLLALQPAMVTAQDAPPPPRDAAGGRRGMMLPRTRAEVEAMTRARFARMDANGDGVVTRAEYDAFRAARMERRGDMPPPPGAGMAPPGPDGGPPPPPEGMGRMGGGRDWFERNDRDHDGRVTFAEALAGPMAMFDRADTNHDGVISDAERDAAMRMMEERRERRGGDGGGQ